MKQLIAASLLISLLGYVVYADTFDVPFQFDDETSITQNSAVWDISDLKSIWGYDESAPRRFLVNLSFALNYSLGELDPFGYHVLNLLVHVTTAILVWYLTILLYRCPTMKERSEVGVSFIALFAGLFFVSHPLNTQGVTYIVQRAASMSAMFYILAVCLYVRMRLHQVEAAGEHEKYDRKVTLLFISVLFVSLCAQFTKENAFTLPLAIVMVEIYFFSGLSMKKLREVGVFLVPVVLLMVVIPVVGFIGGGTPAEGLEALKDKTAVVSSSEYLMTQFRVLPSYIVKLFFPLHLHVDYDFSVSRSLLHLPTMTGLFILIGLVLICIASYHRMRFLSFGILWFFLTLSIESSVVPLSDVIFEHRMYLALTVVVAVVVSLLEPLRRGHSRVFMTVLICLLFFSSGSAIARNGVWRDELSLWTDSLRKSPGKARVQNNRAKVLRDLRSYERSYVGYRRAVDIDPEFRKARDAYALALFSSGRTEEAVEYYETLLERHPDNYRIRYDFAVLLTGLQIYDRAIEQYSEVLKRNPEHEKALGQIGTCYLLLEKYNEASVYYRLLLRVNPESAITHHNLGYISYKRGLYDAAREYLLRAIELDPSYTLSRELFEDMEKEILEKDNGTGENEK